MPESYVCVKCGKVAKTKQALERHAAYHEDDRPFACEVCHQRFKNSDDRGKHYRRLRHDGKFHIACTVCHKHFKSMEILDKHQKILGCLLKNQLETVDISGGSNTGVGDGGEKSGIFTASGTGGKNHHSGGTNLGNGDSVSENISSGVTETGNQDLNYHFLAGENVVGTSKLQKNDTNTIEHSKQSQGKTQTHSQQSEGQTGEQRNLTGLKVVKCACKFCHAEFMYVDSLKAHYINVHNEKKRQVCIQCGQTLSSKDSLARHYSIFHQDEFSFQCSLCDQKFKIKEGLCRHVKFVHKDQGYECEVCHKVFSQPVNLKKHMALHVTVKEFVCSVCGREFRWKQALHKHMLTHSRQGERSDQSFEGQGEGDGCGEIENWSDEVVERSHQKGQGKIWGYDLDAIDDNKVHGSKGHGQSWGCDQKAYDGHNKPEHESHLDDECQDEPWSFERSQNRGHQERSNVKGQWSANEHNKRNIFNSSSTNEPIRRIGNPLNEHLIDSSAMQETPWNNTHKSRIEKMPSAHRHGNFENTHKSSRNIEYSDKTRYSGTTVIECEDLTFFEDPENAVDGHTGIDNYRGSINDFDGLDSCSQEKNEILRMRENKLSSDFDEHTESEYGIAENIFHSSNANAQGKRKGSNEKGNDDCHAKVSKMSDAGIGKFGAGCKITSSGSKFDLSRNEDLRHREQNSVETTEEKSEESKQKMIANTDRSKTEFKSSGSIESCDSSSGSVNSLLRTEKLEMKPAERVMDKRALGMKFQISVESLEQSKLNSPETANGDLNAEANKKGPNIMDWGDGNFGKFSLLKHMLTLKNEDKFHKAVFENPLYRSPTDTDIKDIRRFVERHQYSDQFGNSLYDLSAKQNIPLVWLGMSKSKNITGNRIMSTSMCDEQYYVHKPVKKSKDTNSANGGLDNRITTAYESPSINHLLKLPTSTLIMPGCKSTSTISSKVDEDINSEESENSCSSFESEGNKVVQESSPEESSPFEDGSDEASCDESGLEESSPKQNYAQSQPEGNPAQSVKQGKNLFKISDSDQQQYMLQKKPSSVEDVYEYTESEAEDKSMNEKAEPINVTSSNLNNDMNYHNYEEENNKDFAMDQSRCGSTTARAGKADCSPGSQYHIAPSKHDKQIPVQFSSRNKSPCSSQKSETSPELPVSKTWSTRDEKQDLNNLRSRRCAKSEKNGVNSASTSIDSRLEEKNRNMAAQSLSNQPSTTQVEAPANSFHVAKSLAQPLSQGCTYSQPSLFSNPLFAYFNAKTFDKPDSVADIKSKCETSDKQRDVLKSRSQRSPKSDSINNSFEQSPFSDAKCCQNEDRVGLTKPLTLKIAKSHCQTNTLRSPSCQADQSKSMLSYANNSTSSTIYSSSNSGNITSSIGSSSSSYNTYFTNIQSHRHNDLSTRGHDFDQGQSSRSDFSTVDNERSRANFSAVDIERSRYEQSNPANVHKGMSEKSLYTSDKQNTAPYQVNLSHSHRSQKKNDDQQNSAKSTVSDNFQTSTSLDINHGRFKKYNQARLMSYKNAMATKTQLSFRAERAAASTSDMSVYDLLG